MHARGWRVHACRARASTHARVSSTGCAPCSMYCIRGAENSANLLYSSRSLQVTVLPECLPSMVSKAVETRRAFLSQSAKGSILRCRPRARCSTSPSCCTHRMHAAPPSPPSHPELTWRAAWAGWSVGASELIADACHPALTSWRGDWRCGCGSWRPEAGEREEAGAMHARRQQAARGGVPA